MMQRFHVLRDTRAALVVRRCDPDLDCKQRQHLYALTNREARALAEMIEAHVAATGGAA